jgi:hypothetical protein
MKMSKNPSEGDRTRSETDEHKRGSHEQQHEDQGKGTQDQNPEQHERHRQGEAMRRHNAKQKFVSDEDIKRRTA